MVNNRKPNSQLALFKVEAKNLCFIILGVFCAAMGIKGFLLSSNFIDGGITGVSMLLAKLSGTTLSLWIPLVNLPFIVTAYFHMGDRFAVRSICAIAGLSAALAWIPFPDVTSDLFLKAIFGGVFLGAGIGLSVRGGAVLDGTEVAALIISKKGYILRVGDVILVFNVVLFLAAISILGTEAALYSIVTYFSAARTLDFILYGIEEYTGVMIVSQQSEEIKSKLISELGRGVTVYQGVGGHTGIVQSILYSVVTRLEIGKVRAIIYEIDSNAFITLQTLAYVEGGTLKKRAHH